MRRTDGEGNAAVGANLNALRHVPATLASGRFSIKDSGGTMPLKASPTMCAKLEIQDFNAPLRRMGAAGVPLTCAIESANAAPIEWDARHYHQQLARAAA